MTYQVTHNLAHVPLCSLPAGLQQAVLLFLTLPRLVSVSGALLLVFPLPSTPRSKDLRMAGVSSSFESLRIVTSRDGALPSNSPAVAQPLILSAGVLLYFSSWYLLLSDIVCLLPVPLH